MADPTIDELTAKYSLTDSEVKRLNGVLWRDSLSDPLGSCIGDVVRVADDWRFANWLKRAREANPSKESHSNGDSQRE